MTEWINHKRGIITRAEVIVKQRSPEYTENIERWKFLRAAITRKLKGTPPDESEDRPVKYAEVHEGAKRVNSEKKHYHKSYIVRQQVESGLSYRNRVIKANDGGEARRVLSAYVGDISRAGYTLDLSAFPDDIKQCIENNIDGKNTSFPNFVSDIAEEIGGMGKSYTIACSYRADSVNAGIPYAELVRRENITDMAYNSEVGQYYFVTTEREIESFDADWNRTCSDQYLCISTDKYQIGANVDGICKITLNVDNPLKTVPIAEGWFGKDGLSLVDTIADIQFLLMNSDSILNQLLTLQALNILMVPAQKDIEAQLSTLSAATFLKIDQGQTAASWLGYPSGGLDAHFRYIDRLIKQALESSARTATNPTVETSGYRQSFSWLDTETNLHILAEATESCVNDTLKNMALYLNIKLEGKPFNIKRQFDPKGLKEKLEIILQAIGINIGQTAEQAMKKVARDSLAEIGVNLTPDEIKVSDNEIESDKGLDDIVQGLQNEMNTNATAIAGG